MKIFKILFITAFCALFLKAVEVKYFGKIDETRFEKLSIGKSSFIKSVLYDKKSSKLLVKLNKNWYMYCNVKDVSMWQKKDINASRVYLNFYKGNKKLFCH